MPRRRFILSVLLLLAAPSAEAVINNDNTRPAGRLDADVLTVRMVADVGTWHPEGSAGASLKIAGFGEESSEISVPGPLLRVREGMTIAVSLRNALSTDLHVTGFCSRPGVCDAVSVPKGTTRNFRFKLNAVGTYYYWASTESSTLRKRPRFATQLGGAIVVDARDALTVDRVFVISAYDEPSPTTSDPRIQLVPSAGESRIFAINGASWPHTETLAYRTGETVRWRVVNLSNIGHAMHLHGFHFALHAKGDGAADNSFTPEQQRHEVTEFVGVGGTFAMQWTPTRPGNWLFHCHMVEHMAAAGADAYAHGADERAAGMAGLVLGIRIVGAPSAEVPASSSPRHLRLVLREEQQRYGSRAGFRMDVEGTDAPRLDAGPVPGPVLVLQRGEPVEIEVLNRLSEPTAIHWHGIELESYFDGVPGYAGDGDRIAPAIAPGASFTARFTPPRSGTFIYHTHWHDDAQLAGGLYGALLVLDPGERYDPAVDHVVIIGLNGVLVGGGREPFALNGRETPAPIVMRAGVANRLRLINITANNSILTAFLLDQFEPTKWIPFAKDGATLPSDEMKPQPARQLVSVGETYDFQVVPARTQNLWLEVRRGNGEWVLQAPVVVR